MTNNIIRFPIRAFVPRPDPSRNASVIILPVVRIERHPSKLPNPYLPRRRTLREMSSIFCGND